MKKIATLLLAALMAAALAGCSSPGGNNASTGYPVDGYAEGKMGDTMHTYFFDFAVNSAYVCSQYETYTPEGGNELLVAEVTVKNTFKESIDMYDTDFQVQWNDDADDAYDVPITCYMEETEVLNQDVLPAEYPLKVNESRTGVLVFEVPAGRPDFSISYVEYFDDDSEGDTFFVFFSADKK